MSRLVLALLVGLAAPAWSADPAPDKLVAYREKDMKTAANHLSLASMIAKGEVARPQDALMHSVALSDHAKHLLELFPATTSTDKVKSESKPAVWTDWTGFETAAKAYQTETAKLVETAKEPTLDNWKVQVGKVGESCGGCHDKFRVEDEH
jgi:cytochrome c556